MWRYFLTFTALGAVAGLAWEIRQLVRQRQAARAHYTERERLHRQQRQQFAAWREAISQELRQIGRRGPSGPGS